MESEEDDDQVGSDSDFETPGTKKKSKFSVIQVIRGSLIILLKKISNKQMNLCNNDGKLQENTSFTIVLSYVKVH